MVIKKIILIIIFISIVFFLFYVVPRTNILGNVIATIRLGNKEVATLENLGSYMEKTSVVKALPKNSLIAVNIYSDDKNSIIKSYSIKGNSVSEGSINNPDAVIGVPQKYIAELNKNSICETAKLARNNGDLDAKLNMNQLDFIRKYWRMVVYQGCFGLE